MRLIERLPEIIEDVRFGELRSAYVLGMADRGHFALSRAGYKIPSLEQAAELRLQEIDNRSVQVNPILVQESMLYVPQSGICLVRGNPLLEDLEETINVSKTDSHYFVDDNEVERLLDYSIEVERERNIPLNKFGEKKLPAFMFGTDICLNYAELAKMGGSNVMPLWLASLHATKAFVNPIWLGSVFAGSPIAAGTFDFKSEVFLRGVKRR